MSYKDLLKIKPYIIAFGSQKGGVGKSTLAYNVGHGLVMRGFKVIILDCDPTATSRYWSSQNSGSILPVIGMDKEESTDTIAKDIENICQGYEIIILDLEGRICHMAIKSLILSDLFIVPVTSAGFDIEGSADLVDLIKTRQMVKNGFPKSCFLLNKYKKNTILSKNAVERLKKYELPVMKCMISEGELYKQSGDVGETVFSHGENQLAHELNSAIEEIIATYISRVEYDRV